jgi:NAD(P)-dependent dehydrogenase (short-subunit alcohol dehydrogenase family)
MIKLQENDRKNWNPDLAYGRSKTANILTALHLARQNIQSFSLHPGFILTNMHAKIPREVLQAKGFYDADWNVTVPLKSLSQGAATIVLAALDGGLIAKNGAYLMDCAVVEGEGALVSEVAKSMEEAETLWKVSEDLTGEKFAF